MYSYSYKDMHDEKQYNNNMYSYSYKTLHDKNPYVY